MIKYIRKRIRNWRLSRFLEKRKNTLLFLKNSQNSVNDRWVRLISNKECLSKSEYDKWNIYLKNYEERETPDNSV